MPNINEITNDPTTGIEIKTAWDGITIPIPANQSIKSSQINLLKDKINEIILELNPLATSDLFVGVETINHGGAAITINNPVDPLIITNWATIVNINAGVSRIGIPNSLQQTSGIIYQGKYIFHYFDENEYSEISLDNTGVVTDLATAYSLELLNLTVTYLTTTNQQQVDLVTNALSQITTNTTNIATNTLAISNIKERENFSQIILPTFADNLRILSQTWFNNWDNIINMNFTIHVAADSTISLPIPFWKFTNDAWIGRIDSDLIGAPSNKRVWIKRENGQIIFWEDSNTQNYRFTRGFISGTRNKV